jgi:SAM-dependent methyltransferase
MTRAAGSAVADTNGLASLALRPCPVCGNGDETNEMYPQRLDLRRVDAMSYASRKEPEYMSLRMVVCPGCDLLYAPRIPSGSFLARAYAETEYDSDVEARYAAASYAESLRNLLERLPDRDSALEIGAGNGAFLGQLLQMGFARVLGIEPSSNAANAAAPELRQLIRVESFDATKLPQAGFSLVVANQTLEHVEDPYRLLAAIRGVLKPGGAVMIVSHNYRHWLMRLMGARSPIIDIEHLQVFSPGSLTRALGRAGFDAPAVRPFENRYPLHYWVRLLPLPRGIKRPLHTWLRSGTGGWLGGAEFRVSVGNMLAWANVARSEPPDGITRSREPPSV